ncbi:MAG: 3-hydroxyacyl-CoA dehydrogenase [Burkholderiales bacterium]
MSLARSADVAVVGAGAMGAGIAQVAAQAGHRVRLFDTRMGAADAAKQQIAEALRKLAGKGKLDPAEAEAAAARIVPVHALGDLVSAKLVVEAIVEDLEIKRKTFRELEVVVDGDAVLASNTSSFSITSLAAGMKHPGRIAGMHFFNPAPILPLVEVVSGLATDPAVAALVYDTANAWGKVPVHARSTPGFIVNRCARPFYGEALRLMLENAADAATLDAVMREAGGFRMGPFELMDMIGLDVNFAVTKSVWEAYFHDPRYAPSILQSELVAGGFLGRKSGRGFYDYAPNAAKPVPATEPACAGPAIADLRAQLAASQRIAAGEATLVPCDGRTATAVAAELRHRNVVVYDLALDYATCTRLAVARAEGCSDAAYASAVGALQAAGIAVSRLQDVAGLAVMRTVAMLANEAADAVNQGIASARDVDLAMRNGVNYPRGPLAWADALGVARVRTVLAHLLAQCGDPRYRTSPLIARQERLTHD